ncbi:hypothetical protein C4K19_4420 [Pseudomonas chlororaphis subsp. aurantiaca]|nr:hypothetical protein C4K19_4420 [Pseudomonas chlororaphis subsp. aurantiaca]AZD62207.1 hypothetical protein C4K18_4248 [Pseudomonas chlororaphis subsp. aurantiaca]
MSRFDPHPEYSTEYLHMVGLNASVTGILLLILSTIIYAKISNLP